MSRKQISKRGDNWSARSAASKRNPLVHLVAEEKEELSTHLAALQQRVYSAVLVACQRLPFKLNFPQLNCDKNILSSLITLRKCSE
jgi:hypothetical protein